MSQSITCPNCSFQIEVSDALSVQLREELRREFQADARRKERILADKEASLCGRELAVEDTRRSLEEQIAMRLNAERARLEVQARNKAAESVALEIRDLQDQLTDATAKALTAQQTELQLRRERRELEEHKRDLELTVTRTLDEERAKVREEVKRRADDEHRLQAADKDKLISDLRNQIDDLKRVSEQGSPQARGEVMELVLEELLRDSFAQDTIEAVPVSYHGGDVLQHVHDCTGLACGTILWESKRTKNWNDGWLAKLRDDQRSAKAHVAVLVTAEMPKDIAAFGCMEGVWVTSRLCLLGLASALRLGMIEAARGQRSADGRQSKADLLYNYLSSMEFRQRIEGIVEAFVTMKEDLDSEKRSLHRIWAKREKQLGRAVANTAGLYGDLAGIIGSGLPEIANLELASITVARDSEELQKAPWD